MSAIARREDNLAALSAVDAALSLPGENLARMSSGEQVRLYIRRLIFDGVLQPGQRVPQDAVAQALGVSRIPVREALIALEHEGWVTQIVHRGAFVNALDEMSVRDHYELFGLFCGFGVRRAVERQGTALARPLEAISKRMAKSKDVVELARLLFEFHRVVIDGANSPRLKTVLRQMNDIVPGNVFELVPGTAEVVREGAAAIVAAIDRGYSEIAEREYAEMLRKQGDLVVKLFEERGMFDAAAEEPVR